MKITDMKKTAAVLLGSLAMAGCANSSLRVDTATMPMEEFAGTIVDVDEAALWEASHALGNGGTLPATIQQRAKALADVDYVAGAFNTHVRWLGMDGVAQEEMLIARREVRGAFGVPEGASSQSVVDAFLAISRAQTPTALQASLANPVFSLGAQATQARLENFPALSTTPGAIADLNRFKNRNGGGCIRMFC